MLLFKTKDSLIFKASRLKLFLPIIKNLIIKHNKYLIILHICLSLQLQLNYLGNYVPTVWTYETGCGICDDDLLFFSEVPAPLSGGHNEEKRFSCQCLNSTCVFVCSGRTDASGLRRCFHRTCNSLHGGVPGAPVHSELPKNEDSPLHPQQRTMHTRTEFQFHCSHWNIRGRKKIHN